MSLSQILALSFGSIAKGWMSYIKWIVIGLLALGVIWAGNKGFEAYKSYQTLVNTVEEQKNQLNQQDAKIQNLEGEKERLEKEIKLLKASEEITSEVTGVVNDTQEKSKSTLTDIKEDRQKQEEIIKETKTVKVTKPAPKGSATKTVTEVQPIAAEQVPAVLSEVRINSIWKSYCSSNRPRQESVDTCAEILKKQ